MGEDGNSTETYAGRCRTVSPMAQFRPQRSFCPTGICLSDGDLQSIGRAGEAAA
jgi:hypothetical protein